MKYLILFICLFVIVGSSNVFSYQNNDEELIFKAIKKFYIAPPKGKEIIRPKRLTFNKNKINLTLLSQYKPLKQFKKIPHKYFGDKIKVLPLAMFNFLPFREYYIKWENKKDLKIIVVGEGIYSLKHLWKLVNNSKLISRKGNVYTLKTPMFITKKGSLVIKNEELRLDVVSGAPIIVNGKLYIANSKVLAWNTEKNKYDEQPNLSKKDFYLYGNQKPRPYITTIKGGALFFINNVIRGLGYRGLFSSFGISLNSWHNPNLKLGPLDKLFGTECSTGVFVGNEINDNYMGFYSNNACRVAFVGNYIHDNLQYGFDPHDWSENLFVALNYFSNTKYSHGLVYSRFVKGTVYKNLLVGNNGAGIMMDRSSNSVIEKNVVFENRLGGVSIIESDNNFIENNLIIRNNTYGIYVRNSLNINITNNKVIRNNGAGVNVANANIKYQIYRNLLIDKYHEASSGWIEGNLFDNNLDCDVKSTNGGALALYKNIFKDNSRILCRSIARYLFDVISYQDSKPVVINGYGSRKIIGLKEIKTLPVIEDILYDLSKDKSVNSSTAMGLIELNKKHDNEGINWLISSASRGDIYSFMYLGIKLLSENNNEIKKEGLLLISQAAVCGNKDAQQILYLLPLLSDFSNEDIEESIEVAGKRIKKGLLINCDVLKNNEFCCQCDYERLKFLKKKAGIFFKRFALSKTKSFHSFFYENIQELLMSNMNSKVSELKIIINKKNHIKNKFFEWYEKQKDKIGKQINFRNYTLLRFLYKRKALSNYTIKLLQAKNNEDFDYIKKEVRNVLSNINEFRISKLDIEEIIRNIRGKYFAAH